MPFVVDKDKFVAHLADDPATSFTVFFFGATVSSWTVGGHELLFLSRNALLNGSKAIRGGVPIVFPQFGTVEGSKLPQHGFARCSYWKLTQYLESKDQISVTLTLTPNDVDPILHALWDYKFHLEYELVLNGSGTLSNVLRVKNTDVREFGFTWLLHTYIRVPSLKGTEILGLDGLPYTDKTRNRCTLTQSGPLTITEEVDRVFANVLPVSKRISVNVDGKSWMSVERTNSSQRTGFSDVVTWNPWEKTAKGMTDFGDDEYHHMVCVEVGDVANTVSVKPGHTREAGQILHATAVTVVNDSI